MARETKAERLAREEAERFLAREELRESYHERLLSLMERAQAANFEVTVRAAGFLLEDRDDRRERVLPLTLVWDDANEDNLGELSWRVDMKEEAGREAQRKVLVKQNALSKLSQEERELLGL